MNDTERHALLSERGSFSELQGASGVLSQRAVDGELEQGWRRDGRQGPDGRSLTNDRFGDLNR